jgi:hypothetical protein
MLENSTLAFTFKEVSLRIDLNDIFVSALNITF